MLDWAALYRVIDVVSTISSIPIAVVGFFIAIAQIRKTRAAAEAARDTASIARAEANRAGILILLPQLQRIEEQIDRAVELNSAELVITWANTWRWQAGQLSGHMNAVAGENSSLPALLQTSVMAASSVKTSLVGAAGADLTRATKRMRESIMTVTSELGALAVHYAAYRGDDSQ